MEWIARPNIGFKHKIGNMIGGLLKVIDGLITLISFGNLSTNLCLNYMILRKRHNFMLDNNK